MEPSLQILSELGNIPAVSFHETWMSSKICSLLDESDIPWVKDRYNNIIASINTDNSSDRGIAFIAHMDHPGFEIIDHTAEHLVAKPLGGIPSYGSKEGVDVQIVIEPNSRYKGHIVGPNPVDNSTFLVYSDALNSIDTLPVPAVFDLVDFKLESNIITMRALDDLAGCAAMISILKSRISSEDKQPIYGIFTCAEEVGLVGARLLAKSGLIPKSTYVVSIEASRTLPGAEVGKGPVIRVGDAGTTFDNEAESILVKAKENLTKTDKGFTCQRQLMSGGVCEASAFWSEGYQTTGMAFPLGNYHNGGPDEKILAEYIHENDFLNGVALLTQSTYHVNDLNPTIFQQRFQDLPDSLIKRLI
tara:strand:+ start:15076 stop:16155 length:1080 start_codon:yes stop_codon:yes gene_type:complete